MTRISTYLIPLCATLILAGGCIPKPAATPSARAPVAKPAPAPVTTQAEPAPALPDPASDWRIWPRIDGQWMAKGNVAGLIDSERKSVFSVQCDADDNRISLIRHGIIADGKALTIRTSFGERTITGTRASDMEGAIIAIRLPQNDVLLDQIIYSRGYFGIATPGNQSVRIAASPEIARIVETCRKR